MGEKHILFIKIVKKRKEEDFSSSIFALPCITYHVKMIFKWLDDRGTTFVDPYNEFFSTKYGQKCNFLEI